METEHGSGSTKNSIATAEEKEHLEQCLGDSNLVKSDENSEGIRESSEHTTSDQNGSKSSISLSSSSSGISLEDDCFQLYPLLIPRSKPTDETVPPKLEEEENSGSSPPISQVSVVTQESYAPVLSPAQSPPAIQMMDRASPEPPIPAASAIARSPSPMNWSIASNESMFSIQIDKSYSRDHIIRFGGGEPYKHSAYFKPDELDYSSELYKSGDFISPGWGTGASQKPKEIVLNGSITFRGGIVPDCGANSANSHAYERRNSCDSFAFPIMQDSSNPPCFCTNCSWQPCSCKRPCCSSCFCKPPNCCRCLLKPPACSGSYCCNCCSTSRSESSSRSSCHCNYERKRFCC